MKSPRRAGVAAALLFSTAAAVGVATPALAAAANDTFAGAQSVTLGFSGTLDTTDAGTDADDATVNAFCGAPATDASVWYSYMGTGTGVVVDVNKSTYSAGAIVATGNPVDGFEVVTCGPGAVSWLAEAGQTYSILAFDDQFDGGGNGGTLAITVGEVPPPPQIDLTVNRNARFDTKTGAATVSGTLTCSGAEAVFMDSQLKQRVGRFYVRGWGFAEVPCTGSPQAWTMQIVGDNGKFAGGKAASVTFAFACGTFECGESYVERTVQLSGGKR